MQSEHDVQQQIIDYFIRRGYLPTRQNAGDAISRHTGNRMQLAAAGSTDLTVAGPFGTHYIEVKKPGWNGKLEKTQEDMHRLLKGFGLIVHVVKSLSEVEMLYNVYPDGNPELVKQIIYRPRVNTRAKGYLGEYVPFEEWEQTNAAS